jgi:hypothetical protein
MAVIHRSATVIPSKQELVSAWLPSQSWFAGEAPRVTRAGGFRLDDPAGEVGIEFMLAGDEASGAVYAVPLTYRGAPMADDAGLIGTTDHSVLGRRWVYDAVHDPVFLAQVEALARGEVLAQAQSETDVVDSSVVIEPEVDTAPGDRVVEVVRILGQAVAPGIAAVVVGWTTPAGQPGRGPVAIVRLAPAAG